MKKRKWRWSKALGLAAMIILLPNCFAEAEEVTVGAASEAGTEGESVWRRWDKTDVGMECEEISGELAAKAAEWRARMEAAGETRRKIQPGQPERSAEQETPAGQQEIYIGQQSGPAEDAPSGAENEAKNIAEDSEYIFPDSDMRYLTREEVESLSLQAACYAKNEIYARHGRMFQSRELQEYFGEKSWYMGFIKPEEFSDKVFNSWEQANIKLIQSWEYTLSGSGYPLDQEGYDIHNF